MASGIQWLSLESVECLLISENVITTIEVGILRRLQKTSKSISSSGKESGLTGVLNSRFMYVTGSTCPVIIINTDLVSE